MKYMTFMSLHICLFILMLYIDPSLCHFLQCNTIIPINLITYYYAKNIQYRL